LEVKKLKVEYSQKREESKRLQDPAGKNPSLQTFRQAGTRGPRRFFVNKDYGGGVTFAAS